MRKIEKRRLYKEANRLLDKADFLLKRAYESHVVEAAKRQK